MSARAHRVEVVASIQVARGMDECRPVAGGRQTSPPGSERRSGGFDNARGIDSARHVTGVLLTLDCSFVTSVGRPFLARQTPNYLARRSSRAGT